MQSLQVIIFGRVRRCSSHGHVEARCTPHRCEARLLAKALLVFSPFAQESFLRTMWRDVRRSRWRVFIFPPRGSWCETIGFVSGDSNAGRSWANTDKWWVGGLETIVVTDIGLYERIGAVECLWGRSDTAMVQSSSFLPEERSSGSHKSPIGVNILLGEACVWWKISIRMWESCVAKVVKRLREPCVSRFSSRLGEARAGNRTRHCFGVVSRFQVWNHARVDREWDI